MKTGKQFVNTLEDNIRECGAMSRLLSDRAQVEIGARVVGIYAHYKLGSDKVNRSNNIRTLVNTVIRH